MKLFKKVTRFIASTPVYLYRLLLRPFLPKSCAFVPTCSEYALIAIKQRGIFVGWWLALGRILRCNPFNKNAYGIDPVPCKKECSCTICLAPFNSPAAAESLAQCSRSLDGFITE